MHPTSTQTTKLHNFSVTFADQAELSQLKKEIFTQDAYYFLTENPEPIILDIGAHIGLSCLYFKKLYPKAKIWAFEPHPSNFALLEANIFHNNLTNITALPLAVSVDEAPQQLFSDSVGENWLSNASLLARGWNDSQNNTAMPVQSITLAAAIAMPSTTIDLLKMDVEGIEEALLTNNAASLQKVKQIIFEWHPRLDQSWYRCQKVLKRAGFTWQIWADGQQLPKQARYLRKEPGRLVLIKAEKVGS